MKFIFEENFKTQTEPTKAVWVFHLTVWIRNSRSYKSKAETQKHTR